jgi:hypothetical protein
MWSNTNTNHYKLTDGSNLAQQPRQLGDVRRDPPRLSEKLVERHWQWIAGTCC